METYDNSLGRNTKQLLRKLEAAKSVRENTGNICLRKLEAAKSVRENTGNICLRKLEAAKSVRENTGNICLRKLGPWRGTYQAVAG
jgi:hypothetical protein